MVIEGPERIAVPVPALIDMDTWEIARRQLQLNRQRASRNNEKYDYLLKSLLLCAHCHRRMLIPSGTGDLGPYAQHWQELDAWARVSQPL